MQQQQQKECFLNEMIVERHYCLHVEWAIVKETC